MSSDLSATSITDHIEFVEEEAVRLSGVRPKGNTDVNMKLISDSVIAAKNEITDLYMDTRANTGASKVDDNILQER